MFIPAQLQFCGEVLNTFQFVNSGYNCWLQLYYWKTYERSYWFSVWWFCWRNSRDYQLKNSIVRLWDWLLWRGTGLKLTLFWELWLGNNSRFSMTSCGELIYISPRNILGQSLYNISDW
jgi:hypothetical protein